MNVYFISKGKFPTTRTPPPQKRNKLYPDVFHPLTKSPSHESQLAHRVNHDTDMTKYAFSHSPNYKK